MNFSKLVRTVFLAEQLRATASGLVLKLPPPNENFSRGWWFYLENSHYFWQLLDNLFRNIENLLAGEP